MKLTLYNTLTRKKELFKPLKPGAVSLYTCGPTVYNYAHIGNLRTYIFEDILRRTLEQNGYTVTHVMNITDVGHLTSNEDTGEDKVEKKAREQSKSAIDIARMYEEAFKKDIEDLNIFPPHTWCRATEHIAEQINLIQTLEKKGFTYQTSDGIYFDTSHFPDYGKLAKKNIAGIQSGARVDEREKKNPTDFALWKFSPKKESRQMEWESPWGVGFPGWHVECSAMSMKYLGESFDIHCGGVDHIQIHHTNEIAQSEAATEKPLAHYWMHGEFLELKDGKMAKSEGTGITLATLKEKGFDPLDFRYLTLTAHYRTKLNFSWESLEAAQKARRDIITFIADLLSEKKIVSDDIPYDTYYTLFSSAVSDDLNIPKALGIVHTFIKNYRKLKEKNAVQAYNLLLQFDTVLGLNLTAIKKPKKESIPNKIRTLLHERNKARAEKDWDASDRLRTKIEKAGWRVLDTLDTSTVEKISHQEP